MSSLKNNNVYEVISAIIISVFLIPYMNTPQKVTELEPAGKIVQIETVKFTAETAPTAAVKSIATATSVHVAAAPKQTPPTVITPTGTCASWMSAAGITDTANATRLLNWESHCNPNAVNPSSGACGLQQELPCGKSGCGLGNGACQMKWFNRYVIQRYGSMAAAVIFHIANGWY